MLSLTVAIAVATAREGGEREGNSRKKRKIKMRVAKKKNTHILNSHEVYKEKLTQ